MAPRKVRLIADTLRGLSVNEAEAQLLYRPQRANEPLLKLLRSAVANAKNNYKLNADKLAIKTIIVNQGPMMKRFLPRAMGRATPIQKKMSHVTIILKELSNIKEPRFNINILKKIKNSKKKKTGSKPKIEVKNEIAQKPKEKAGFFKRLFRRKSV